MGGFRAAPLPPQQRFGIDVYNLLNEARDWAKGRRTGAQTLLGPAAEALLGPALETARRAAEGEQGVYYNANSENPLDWRIKPEPALELAELATIVSPGAKPAMRAGKAVTELPGELARNFEQATVAGLPKVVVHHGTPHRWMPEPEFPEGRPRMDKIGTGEGAQAYGHGVYFAESPGVATAYRDELSRKYMKRGDELTTYGPLIDEVAQRTKELRPGMHPDQYQQVARNVVDDNLSIDDVEGMGEPFESLYAAAIKARGDDVKPHSGTLYELDLPDEIVPNLLDYNAPAPAHLAENRMQFESPEQAIKAFLDTDYAQAFPSAHEVQSAKDALEEGMAKEWVERQKRGSSFMNLLGEETGGALYERAARLRGGPQEANAWLMEQGIPGLRYWDQMSRNAGEGTSNFVVWDQGLLNQMPILGVK